MAKGILDVLVTNGVLQLKDASDIKREAKRKNLSFEDELISRGIDELVIMKAKSEALGIPLFILGSRKVPFDLLKLVPEESARHYQFVPVGIENGTVSIGIVDPDNIESKEAMKFIISRLNRPFKLVLLSPHDFGSVLEEYKGVSGEVNKVLGELESALADEASAVPEIQAQAAPEVEDAPITKMVAVMLRHATEGKASDIHIEPTRDSLRVRFRVDGVLHTSLILPLKVHDSIISRVKILTNMQLDEKRKPQDGRFSARIDEKEVDFRVSTFPTYFGEKVAIRILDSESGVKDLKDLDLEEYNSGQLKQALDKPYGLILITGPTGSGKSTSLYAMLKEVNEEGSNIVSLEDPVEYAIEGINQSQVRPEIGYDFAQGIRHILRQDPDIMMVGEIRDRETAKLAIHAALTGHLVFSTLHTNNAAGVIPRLIDMGVDPYLIAPTLVMAMGQRLVRNLCEESREAVPVEGQLKERLLEEIAAMPESVAKNIQLPDHIYKAKSTVECPKGTRGRSAVVEMMTMNPELSQLVLTRPTEKIIMDEMRKRGMISMHQDGIMKVLKGKIGLEELLEVI
ncbi:type II/IV secretion system protein [Candidatus Giovannonibacteria bacterium]|nr:type II/IV secretion system protein [Candidatus Giovannonibacteria bacterium]